MQSNSVRVPRLPSRLQINNYLKFAMQLFFKPTTAKMLSNLKVRSRRTRSRPGMGEQGAHAWCPCVAPSAVTAVPSLLPPLGGALLQILVIAVLMRFVLRRSFNVFQWEALLLLVAGITGALCCGPAGPPLCPRRRGQPRGQSGLPLCFCCAAGEGRDGRYPSRSSQASHACCGARWADAPPASATAPLPAAGRCAGAHLPCNAACSRFVLQ